MYPYM
jgi:hypothetical protein